MREIESINFKEIEQMIERSLRESEDEERKLHMMEKTSIKEKVAKVLANDEDAMVTTEF